MADATVNPDKMLAVMSFLGGAQDLIYGFTGAADADFMGRAHRQILDTNSQIATNQADRTRLVGEETAGMYLNKVRSFIGNQRVGFAGQGADVNSGTAKEVMTDSASTGAADALQIHLNALRGAAGFDQQALNFKQQSDWEKLDAKNKSRTSILTGGIGALLKFQEGISKLNASKSGSGGDVSVGAVPGYADWVGIP